MFRRWPALIMILALSALLSGCNFRAGDDLYTLPKTSVEYDSLRSSIQSILDSGMEYAAPLSGSNAQPVQDIDLDGDGKGEVVAFFRSSTGLQVSVFWQNNNGEFEEQTTIAGQGSAVNSVSYAQLDGKDNREIVLSWQISSGVYALSAYSVARGNSVELLAPRNYTRYAVTDLDANGQDELVLILLDASDSSSNRAEYYLWQDGGLTKAEEVRLSEDLTVIDKTRVSALCDGHSALFITGNVSDTGESSSRTQLTDILALRDGALTNVTWNENAKSSLRTKRRLFVSDQDLDGDGVWEIPIISSLYERMEDGEVVPSDNFCLVTWMQFDLQGTPVELCSTYYNVSDGWYLSIPREWGDQVALSRREYSLGSTTERSIDFYALIPVDASRDTSLEESMDMGRSVLTNVRCQQFMTIHKNTGADRKQRAGQEGRTNLGLDTEEATYCVEFAQNNWSDWTADTVKENMHIITTSWFND